MGVQRPTFNGQEIRMIVQDDGKVYWAASDICRALGINPAGAAYHVKSKEGVEGIKGPLGNGANGYMLDEISLINFLARLDDNRTCEFNKWALEQAKAMAEAVQRTDCPHRVTIERVASAEPKRPDPYQMPRTGLREAPPADLDAVCSDVKRLVAIACALRLPVDKAVKFVANAVRDRHPIDLEKYIEAA